MPAPVTPRLVRQASISSTGTADSSSHDHSLRDNHHHHQLTSWLHESWAPLFHRHEQIAVGALPRGMTLMTREMMEMQVHQAPTLLGILDYLPTRLSAQYPVLNQGMYFRRKLGTWPLSKHEATVAKQFSA